MSLRKTLEAVAKASHEMAVLRSEYKTDYLQKFSAAIHERKDFLLKENKNDLEIQKGKISPALYQRLELTEEKLESLCDGLLTLAHQRDPIGEVLQTTEVAENFILQKVRVPIGVMAVVFESRPDVIPQILALSLKSGNACVLKGGKEAEFSNKAFMTIIADLNETIPAIDPSWAVLVESREAFQELLAFDDLIDLVIPRGSNQLVRLVQESTKIPVLGHSEGVCHAYVHEKAKLSKAISVVIDSKAQYPSACNALETLLVDEAIADNFLKSFYQEARLNGIELIGCSKTAEILGDKVSPASDEDWRTEYGDLRLAIKVVKGFDEAVGHINLYGSHHTDTILTENQSSAENFLNEVNSASVFWNCSTRFADGYRFGMGAEVGISTNKTHARGPVGIEGLTIYKYLLRGDGETVAQFGAGGGKAFTHRRLNG